MSDVSLSAEEICRRVKQMANGRTRYEDQPAHWDEVLVAEIERLREEIRTLNQQINKLERRIPTQEQVRDTFAAALARYPDCGLGIAWFAHSLALTPPTPMHAEIEWAKGEMTRIMQVQPADNAELVQARATIRAREELLKDLCAENTTLRDQLAETRGALAQASAQLTMPPGLPHGGRST